MLTPVDIQEKTFHTGIGYDKKDVNAFFDEVFKSYSELYRSNAELKEQVNTLTDGLQNYKSKEAELEKSLMLAEKDSEDTKAKALKEAKNIELDARNKANNIVADAEKRLKKITMEVKTLETQYAAYKSNFCSLLKMQFHYLNENDFDVDALIDERALSLLGASGGGSYKSTASTASEPFTGDPQMRDESTLGGTAKATYNEYGEDTRTSTSAVYTSNLGANENFVDPFNTEKSENGRYNPYDGRTAKSSTASTSFKVSAGDGKGPKRNTSKPKSQKSAGSEGGATSFTTADPASKITNNRATKTKATVKEEPKPAPEKEPEPEEVKEEPVSSAAEETTSSYDTDSHVEQSSTEETAASSESSEEETDAIPTIEPDVTDIEDSAPSAAEQALLPDGDEPGEDADDDGFEFV